MPRKHAPRKGPNIELVEYVKAARDAWNFGRQFAATTGRQMPRRSDWRAWLALAVEYGYPEWATSEPPNTDLIAVWIVGKARARQEQTSGTADRNQAESGQSEGDGEHGKRRSSRGRKPDTDAKQDKRIWDAWHTGRYQEYAELARELRLRPREVERAIDRHRKRLERDT